MQLSSARIGLVLWFTLTPGISFGSQETEQPLERLMFGSCIKQQNPAPLLKTIANQKPELFIFLGDNIYGDTNDMEVMRSKYRKLGEQPGFKLLRKTTPLLATWDDHDYGRNDAGREYPHRRASQQEFVRFWDEPKDSPLRKRAGVYQSKMFGPEGKRTQIIMLDTRYFRSPLKRRKERRVGGIWEPDDDPKKTMLGNVQWRWLEDELKKPAEVRIIASSIQFIAEDDGQEAWSNLPVERQRMIDLLKKTRANGVFFISGDRHWSELSSITPDGLYPIYDLTSSSLNQVHSRGTPTKNQHRAIAKTFHKPNYGVIEIDWSAPTPKVSLKIRDVKNQPQIEHTFDAKKPRDAKSRGALRLIEVRKIWDNAPHNAFTDLLHHEGRWYCVFREGRKHVSPDGSLRVITSENGRKWKSLSLVSHPTDDLRDAKLSVTPNGRFMLNGAGMQADKPIRYHSMSWFSSDNGKTWDKGHRIGDPGFWLWRAHWHNDTVYSMGYRTDRNRDKRIMRFYKSRDGKRFSPHISEVNVPNGVGEDRILFLKDGSALCLLRHETGNKMALLGTSQPAFTDWNWRELNLRIGGPNMIQLPDGRILAATRLYEPQQRTSLSWIDTQNATMTETLKLPSGGDTSYPGMVRHDGQLWVSYYSSHEGKAAIYLARVDFGRP